MAPPRPPVRPIASEPPPMPTLVVWYDWTSTSRPAPLLTPVIEDPVIEALTLSVISASDTDTAAALEFGPAEAATARPRPTIVCSPEPSARTHTSPAFVTVVALIDAVVGFASTPMATTPATPTAV